MSEKLHLPERVINNGEGRNYKEDVWKLDLRDLNYSECEFNCSRVVAGYGMNALRILLDRPVGIVGLLRVPNLLQQQQSRRAKRVSMNKCATGSIPRGWE